MTKKNSSVLEWAATYHRLGLCVIQVPYGSKAPDMEWKQFQSKRPNKDQLARWFKDWKHQNIAVVLGHVSNDLACRDFDTRTGYQTWAEQHPNLAKTLPTVRTPHGYHVYFQGEVKRIKYLKDGEGRPAGELRGEGSCCVLPPSIGKDGQRYEWINPPVRENLIWFESEQMESIFCNTGNSHDTEGTDENGWELKGGVKNKRIKKNRKIQEALVKTLPVAFATRHRKIFTFARELKSMPEYEDADPRAFRSIVKEWHRMALPNIRTKKFEETWIDFLMAWADVKYKIGDEPIMQIFKRAVESKPPKIAVRVYPDNAHVQLLVAFCRELQLEAGEKPFFLSARMAGKLFKVVPMTAWRWLYVLVQDDILKVFRKGRITKAGPKATRYKYVRSLKS